MSQPLYTASVHVTNGRGGAARSDDGKLDVALAPPAALGGDGAGTNPEQLLAAGFAACYLSALGAVARRARTKLPEVSATSQVHLHRADDGGFELAVDIVVTVPSDSVGQVRPLLAEAEKTCPYSRATRGNINVSIDVKDS